MQRLTLIFAIDEAGVIGRDGALPWDFPEDRAHFDRTTRGHAVVMGRRTWDERGEPLPGRTNIVVSRTFVPPPGVLVARSLDEALAAAWRIDEEPFVIGGVRLFEEALPRATRVVVTDIPGEHEGDTIFRFDRSALRVVSSREGERGLVFLELEPDIRAVAPTDPAALALVER
jgi:dihydrofolate reductase